jgi:hypothetical protein
VWLILILLDGLIAFQERHAGHIEGNLLSQVRVAHTNQEINVWVLGRTRVRLKIGIHRTLYIFPVEILTLL